MIIDALLIGLGIFLAAGAQLALKLAAAGPHPLPWLGTAALTYLGAFALYFHLLRTLPLSWLSPLMVGGTTLAVVLAGLLLGETMNLQRVLGVALLLAGLWLLALGR